MIIASNFKTNHTRKSTKEYIHKLNSFTKDNDIKNTDIIEEEENRTWLYNQYILRIIKIT